MMRSHPARVAMPPGSSAARASTPLVPPAASSAARRRAPAPRALPDVFASAEALKGATRSSSASAELLSLLLPPGPSTRGAAGDARVAALLEQLAATRRPFRTAQLGGGPWQVVATAGALGWKPLAPGGAIAAQDFDATASRVVNSVTLPTPLGTLRLTAEGDFNALPEGPPSKSTPARFAARIRRGTLGIGMLRVPLPISGEGSFEVAYVDERLRVFRSSTGLAVQVPQAAVQAAAEAAKHKARS